jgi:type VI secretion system protein ImpL
VITFLWGASNLYAQRRASKTNTELAGELAAAPAAGPADAEIDELAERFARAMDQLKKRRFAGRRGRRYLHQLPWYLLIGPPGSGKTTALVQSGLRFPLAQEHRDYEIKGVGGTRNCDWYFTDEAVLIDTAGRFTTQDSHSEADHAAWLGFLDLLKKYRKKRSINGVLVAVSVSDLLEGGEAMLTAHAHAIRSRLTELHERLDVHFPVYVLITKADLLAGFTETFADLGETDREQVWGWTSPLPSDRRPAGTRDAIRPAFDELIARVDQRILERVHAERDLAGRAAIFSFPSQVATLKAPLADFLGEIFYESGYGAAPLLRGVYLTSGTQEGTPIDRLLQAMAASFGLRHEPAHRLQGNRSFFLTRLLRDVVFAEAGLVTSDVKRERRQAWLRRAAWAGAVLLVLGLSAAWWLTYEYNRDRVMVLAQDLVGVAEQAQAVGVAQLSQADRALAPVLPILDELGDLPARQVEAAAAGPLPIGLGLSQQEPLDGYATAAYRHGLERLLLPRLVLRIEDQLRANINDPEFVLEALKVYLMMVGQASLEPNLIATWFEVVDRGADEGFAEPERGRFQRHVDALLALLPQVERRLEPNELLVARARETLQQIPLAQRAYSSLRSASGADALRPWRVGEHAGPNAMDTLVRRSGRNLNAEIPGLFTYDGFYHFVLPALGDLAANTAVENWVLGSTKEEELSDQELARLQNEILHLYYDDYIEQWELLLRDVTLAPLGDLQHSVDVLKAVAGENSPIKLLLHAIVHETKLTVPPPTEEEGSEAGTAEVAQAALKAGSKALGKLGGKAQRLAKLAKLGGGGGAAEASAVVGAPVEEHFAYLAAIVEGREGATPALDQALGTLATLYHELQEIVLSPSPQEELMRRGGLAGVAGSLKQQAGGLPAPLDGWLVGIAETTSSMGEDAIRRQLNALWRADVLPFCDKAIGGRFPFESTSTIDVSLADFSQLFKPGGLIDQFVTTHLLPYVDTARSPWRPKTSVAISSNALAAFQLAEQIRDGMFGGGAQPQMRFALKALDLDTGARRAVLDLDGQTLSYGHGPAQPAWMEWPGPNGRNVVRLTFMPLNQQTPLVTTREGAWSWFRLLREGKTVPTAVPELFDVTLGAGSHWVRFELRAGSVGQPVSLDLLERFRCPANL